MKKTFAMILLLGGAFFPFIFVLIPIIPYIIDEEQYTWTLWFMFLSFPIGVGIMMRTWPGGKFWEKMSVIVNDEEQPRNKRKSLRKWHIIPKITFKY